MGIGRKIRVLIVDDSAIMREMLAQILKSAPDIEVAGMAEDPYDARAQIKALNPDVVTLDVEMPKMDGLTFLEKIMTLRPMPVVMISGLTQDNSEMALRALEIGAVDIVAKSKVNLDLSLAEKEAEIVAKIRGAAAANLGIGVSDGNASSSDDGRVRLPKGYDPESKVIAIGASTGGVEAIRKVLTGMPGNCPAILMVQHMPETFTDKLARRLDGLVAPRVMEATHDARVEPGHVFIAPGDRHLEFAPGANGLRCRLSDGECASGHKPSVDYLFHSAARVAGKNAVGVLLTGMGRDGAKGLCAMRDAGAVTIGQDEVTSTVYGMPKAAFEDGAVERQLPLRGIADAILNACAKGVG